MAVARSACRTASVVERLGPEVVGATLRTIEMSNDAVWFGGDGVVRYEKGVIRRFGKSDGLRSNEVRTIYALADRTWVGTYGGGLQSIEAERPDRQLGRA